MKYALCLIICLTTCNILFSQEAPYYPDGRKFPYKYTSYGSVLDSLGHLESGPHFYKEDVVYFKRLSNKPLIVFTSNPTRIKESIASYNKKYQEYLYSYSYYADMKRMINEGTLTKDYLNEVFGKPDTETTNEDGFTTLVYKKFNARIVFREEVAESATVINYKAIERNGLSIVDFKVTGGDYTIGFDISFINADKRSIKYIFITVTALNPVKDVVGTKTVKAIGPVQQYDNGFYEFDDVIFSRVAQYLIINSIKVQYMDGTLRTIPKSEIKFITIEDWEEVGNRPINN